MRITVVNVHVEGDSVLDVTQGIYETFAKVWETPEEYILRQLTIEPGDGFTDGASAAWTARATGLDKDSFDQFQESLEDELDEATV